METSLKMLLTDVSNSTIYRSRLTTPICDLALQSRNADDDENRETNLPEDLLAEMDLASREKSYRRHFIKLQSLVVEKIKEVEEITDRKSVV